VGGVGPNSSEVSNQIPDIFFLLLGNDVFKHPHPHSEFGLISEIKSEHKNTKDAETVYVHNNFFQS
jgi:hypothetical protein